MVLDASDYDVPGVGSMDPTDTDTYSRMAGLVVGVTLAAFALQFALNRGVPFVNSFASMVGLGTGGAGEGIEVFD